MEVATRTGLAVQERKAHARHPLGDNAFKWLTRLMALAVFVLLALIAGELVQGSHQAMRHFGWSFLTTSDWDPYHEKLGALFFIYCTLVTSAIALLIAVPISIATAVYLTELAPNWLRQPLTMFIELLAAIPSVILGLWGLLVMVPWLKAHLFVWLHRTFGFLPIFRGPVYGPCVLAGGIILAIMVIPIVTTVSREILRSVPGLQREAAYALGATRWEATRIAVLSYAKKGLFGAVILGLGRALGETMAVMMVTGGGTLWSVSLFAPGSTLASIIANEFTEAVSSLYSSALFEIGLVLLGVTVVVNALAQLLLKTFAGPTAQPR